MAKGRPEKKHGLHDDAVSFRVKQHEKERWEEAADKSEEDLSDWRRKVLNKAASWARSDRYCRDNVGG
jgi:hypothetical protein